MNTCRLVMSARGASKNVETPLPVFLRLRGDPVSRGIRCRDLLAAVSRQTRPDKTRGLSGSKGGRSTCSLSRRQRYMTMCLAKNSRRHPPSVPRAATVGVGCLLIRMLVSLPDPLSFFSIIFFHCKNFLTFFLACLQWIVRV